MKQHDFILLDGGMGLELRRRNLIETKTIWSGFALIRYPEAVREVHEAFIEASADVITTNNYGVVRQLLAMENMEDRLAELTELAALLACEARDHAAASDVRIAGSLPPLGSSYRPDLDGTPEEMETTYSELAALLAPHVDILLCETMSSGLQARSAARAAAGTGKTVWVSWSLGEDVDGCLRSGETVEQAHTMVAELPVDCFLFNCCSPESVTRALPELRELTDTRIGAYANTLKPIPKDYQMGARGPHPLRDDMGIADYIAAAKDWRAAGANVIGGCCGIGPEYIAALRRVFPRVTV